MMEIPMTKEELYHMHFELNMTQLDIAQKYNVSRSSIGNFMKHFGIKACRRIIKQPVVGRYGKLEVLERLERKSGDQEKFRCKCDCGNIRILTANSILRRKLEGCQSCSSGNFLGDISNMFWRSIVNSAKAKNRELTITKEYIWELFLKQDRRCAFSGLLLYFHSRPRHKSTLSTASLDRIDSTKGYVEGNVQWVHKKINYMKQSMSDTEFLNFCAIITNHKRLGVNN